jgi:hypothetical protein
VTITTSQGTGQCCTVRDSILNKNAAGGGKESAREFDTLADQLWGQLVSVVARRFPGVEEALAAESAGDALLGLRDDPQRFDPGRGVSLPDYLAMRAWGYLRNRLRGERRYRRREQSGLAWDEKFEGKVKFRVTGGAERTIAIGETDEAEPRRRQFERRLALLKPCERALVGLWLRGVDTLEAWAEALGIGHLPWEEKDRRVRAKKMSLKRKLKSLPAEGPDGASS